MNFGEQEGLHFDGLPQNEKDLMSSPSYQAPGGENWHLVRQRMECYFAKLPVGNHLIFTHGGAMCSVL